MLRDPDGKIVIVTVGMRAFIGKLTGGVGKVSSLARPMAFSEQMKIDQRTGQLMDVSADLRRPCLVGNLPEDIRMIPDTAQILDQGKKRDATLIQNYEAAVERCLADDVGVVAPTPEDVRKANIGKVT